MKEIVRKGSALYNILFRKMGKAKLNSVYATSIVFPLLSIYVPVPPPPQHPRCTLHVWQLQAHQTLQYNTLHCGGRGGGGGGGDPPLQYILRTMTEVGRYLK